MVRERLRTRESSAGGRAQGRENAPGQGRRYDRLGRNRVHRSRRKQAGIPMDRLSRSQRISRQIAGVRRSQFRSNLTGAKTTIVAIQPPLGFGKEVWEGLATQGYLKRDGGGFYQLVPGK